MELRRRSGDAFQGAAQGLEVQVTLVLQIKSRAERVVDGLLFV